MALDVKCHWCHHESHHQARLNPSNHYSMLYSDQTNNELPLSSVFVDSYPSYVYFVMLTVGTFKREDINMHVLTARLKQLHVVHMYV